MKKVFSMLLILGICASIGAFAHGPPGHTEKLTQKNDKFSEVNQVVAAENSAVETISVTNKQALPAGQPLADLSESVEVTFGVSSDWKLQRSPTFATKWRVDRSRCYRCSLILV